MRDCVPTCDPARDYAASDHDSMLMSRGYERLTSLVCKALSFRAFSRIVTKLSLSFLSACFITRRVYLPRGRKRNMSLSAVDIITGVHLLRVGAACLSSAIDHDTACSRAEPSVLGLSTRPLPFKLRAAACKAIEGIYRPAHWYFYSTVCTHDCDTILDAECALETICKPKRSSG